MEYKVLKNKDIDKSRWDECVTESTTPDIYALSWYLDCVCPTWQALVFGDYEAVFPICKTYKFGFLPVISAPYLTKDFGIYAKNVDLFLNSEVFGIIRKELKKSIKLKYQIKKNIDLGLKYEIRTKQIIEFENNTTYPIYKLRQSLKNSSTEGYIVFINKDYKNALNFIKQNLAYLVDIEAEKYLNVLSNLCENNPLFFHAIFLSLNNEVCGCMIFSKFQNRLFLLQNAGNINSKKGGMHFLIYSAIEKFRPEIEVVDFMGSNLEKVKLFNKNFCNKEVEYKFVNENFI